MNVQRGGTACRHGRTPTLCALVYAHFWSDIVVVKNSTWANSFVEETA